MHLRLVLVWATKYHLRFDHCRAIIVQYYATASLFACFDTQVTPPNTLHTTSSSLVHCPTPLFSWQYFVARSAPVTGLHPLVTAITAVHVTLPLLRSTPRSTTLRYVVRPSDGSPPLCHHNGDIMSHFFACLAV